MATFDMAGTMDALAAKVPASTYRVYAWPVEDATPPFVIVGYPTVIDFDQTFADGSDRAEIPVWYVVGNVATKQARDALSDIIRGASGIKTALDGPLTVGSATASVRVTDCTPETITLAGVQHLAARFDCEVIT
jgi:hypothetical protein